ncbi:MAG TPA: FHA domain-containing protein [Ktedonobacterales bacterium]|nr:FHA domain-containing protein [Ktedonobacterales bacterium]
MEPEAQTPGLASITFLTGPLAGKTFRITQAVTTIGRESDNDLVVKGDLKVSRHHAQLSWRDGSWTVENRSQKAKLLVDQQSVQQAAIQNGAVIGLGAETTFRFVTLAADETSADEDETIPLLRPSVHASESSPSLASEITLVPASEADMTTMPLAPALAEAAAPTPQAEPPRSPTSMVPRPSQTLVASSLLLGLPSLEVSSNTSERRKSYVLDKKIINIGRDVTNDIVIEDQSVSGLHLQVVREGQQLVLIHPHPERQHTANGLLYQGRKIRGDESYRHTLARGDVFRIGDEQGTLVTLSYQDGSGAQQEPLPPMRPIRLGEAELTIGRHSENTVVLPHPQVSAHHARLVREGGAYRIHDLHSTNHIYVNAQLVTNHLLKMGDEIRIGPYRLIYESTHLTQYDESNNIRIDALNLKKAAANQATLLNNISLSIPPRAFVALVGGSGAGKTMLLDALSGLRPAQQGQVLYNGQEYYRNLAAFNTQIGYVPQDDIVHRDLTVERALYYAAKIRLPRDFTDEHIWQRIAEVLEDVELTERRGLLIKKLSGGQRKRVSIALELLANPSLFFLDEPTSGLDPGLDRKMMVLLRKLADKGHTIVLVTHATNNINVCDYVCFLAQGGRLAYYGSPDGAKEFFGKSDFAEIYTALEATDETPNLPEEAEARFKVSQAYQDAISQPLKQASAAASTPALNEVKRARSGGFWKQFTLLSLRRLELLKNDVPTLLVLLLQAPLVAILLMVLIRFGLGPGILDGDNIIQCQPQIRTSTGQVLVVTGVSTQGDVVSCARVTTFLQTDPQGMAYAEARGGVNQALQDFEVAGHNGDAQRIVFMLSLIPVLFGIIGGSREIVKEVAIYRRERAVNLGILPYMLSKVLVFGLLALFQMACVVIIVDVIEPLRQGIFLPVLVETYITLALAGVAGVLLGFVISAWAVNEDMASSLLAVVIVPQVIFCGVIVPLKDVVTQSIAMIFPLRWAMSGLGSSLGLHSDLIGGDRLFGNSYLYHPTLYATYTTDEATQHLVICWVVLVVISVVMILLVGLALKQKDARR